MVILSDRDFLSSRHPAFNPVFQSNTQTVCVRSCPLVSVGVMAASQPRLHAAGSLLVSSTIPHDSRLNGASLGTRPFAFYLPLGRFPTPVFCPPTSRSVRQRHVPCPNASGPRAQWLALTWTVQDLAETYVYRSFLLCLQLLAKPFSFSNSRKRDSYAT